MLKKLSQLLVLLIICSYTLVSCAGETATETGESKAADQNTASATQAAKAAPATAAPVQVERKQDKNASDFLIQESGIAGVFTGDPIGNIEHRITKGQLASGEGNFVTYNFKSQDGKEELGYFLVDINDESLIGDIVITSPAAATSNGIKVGDTFADLKAVAPGLEVHGSEIESRTSAFAGHFAYLLDAAFNTYEVDENKVKPSAKIKQIRIIGYNSKQ